MRVQLKYLGPNGEEESVFFDNVMPTKDTMTETMLKRANAKVAAQEGELIQLRIKVKELTHIITSKDEEIEELRDQLNRNRW